MHLHEDTDDAALAELARFPPENVLSDQKGDKYLQAVAAAHPELTRIDLRGCREVTDAGVMALVEHCPNLTSVDLAGCKRVTIAALAALAQHPSILYLNK